MKKENYNPPEYEKQNFNCPFCNVLAFQQWKYWYAEGEFMYAICQNCGKKHIWKISDKKMIYPIVSTAPLPNEDMPKVVKKIYEEARAVQNLSPRATAALLRVALEKLTENLGEKEGNLNERIGNLNKKGFPEKVIQSLDIVRITANEGGSHAGEIDLTGKDNEEIVNKLFFLINFIVEKVITENKEIDTMFNNLPEDKKQGIENRDNNKE